jgi:hypothetical protein
MSFCLTEQAGVSKQKAQAPQMKWLSISGAEKALWYAFRRRPGMMPFHFAGKARMSCEQRIELVSRHEAIPLGRLDPGIP